jgi:hypothetical protein
MRVYQTPGVYHERPDAAAGGVVALRTDVTALVGIAERGPLHQAVPVESYRQFVAWFGDAIDRGYLAYCARGFFENGGRRLWVVRVASDAAGAASLALTDAVGPAWRIEASSPGHFGNRLAVRTVDVRRVRVPATLDPLDPRRLRVATLAGFERHALVELVRDGVRARAVVAEIDTRDPADPALRLVEAPTPPLPPGPLELRVETIAMTLEVYDAGRLAAVFPELSLVPRHPRYGPRVLKQPWQSIDAEAPESPEGRVPEADLAAEFFRIAQSLPPAPPPPVVIRELRGAAHRALLLPLDGLAGPAPSAPRPLAGGTDGLAALGVDDFIGHSVAPGANPLELAAGRRGIAALDIVDEAALVAVPDIHIRPDPLPRLLPPACVPDPCLPGPPALPLPVPDSADMPPLFDPQAIERVQAALVLHCERRRDRFALLDAPYHCVERLSFEVTELRDWRGRFDSPFAALYAPWLKVVDPRRRLAASRGTTRAIPPCGHVAGRIAATDLRAARHVIRPQHDRRRSHPEFTRTRRIVRRESRAHCRQPRAPRDSSHSEFAYQ